MVCFAIPVSILVFLPPIEANIGKSPGALQSPRCHNAVLPVTSGLDRILRLRKEFLKRFQKLFVTRSIRLKKAGPCPTLAGIDSLEKGFSLTF